jgi:hypothetical protein
MQVCKQIRDEFRPLYLGNIIYIRLSDAERYVQDFLHISYNRMASVKLPIDITRRGGKIPIDILPLLRVISDRDDITVSFQFQGPEKRLTQGLDSAFRQRKQQWQALVRNVSNIYLWPSRNRLTIAFVRGLQDWITEMEIGRNQVRKHLGIKSRHRIKLEILHNVGSEGLGSNPEKHWRYMYPTLTKQPVRLLRGA